MTFIVGQVTEFDDSVTINNPDILALATAVPLAANQGRFWNILGAPSLPLLGKTFEVYGRGLTALTGTVGTGGGTGWLDGADTTALAMNATAIAKLVVGSVLKVEDEIVVVKAIDRVGNTIDVYARGEGSTSGAAHADNTAFQIIGHAGSDTDLRNLEALSENSHVYTNYAQTVFEVVDYTYGEARLRRKGLAGDPLNILRQEAMNRAAAKLAAACLQGVKVAGTSSRPYLTAGLFDQLEDTAGATRSPSRYNAGSAAFTETILKAALDQAFQYGNPNTLVMRQGYKNIMNSFNNAFIITPKENRIGGYFIGQYEYEGKILDILVDQDTPNGKIAIVTKELCKKSWLQDDMLRFVTEPQASSRENRESLQGSVGIVVEGVGYDHTEIYGLTAV